MDILTKVGPSVVMQNQDTVFQQVWSVCVHLTPQFFAKIDGAVTVVPLGTLSVMITPLQSYAEIIICFTFDWALLHFFGLGEPLPLHSLD